MPYSLKTQADITVRETIPRFKAYLWTTNFSGSMMGSLVTTAEDAFTATFRYRVDKDLAGIEWWSKDTYDHPMLMFTENRDYTGVTLAFSVSIRDTNSLGIGETNGPNLILEQWVDPGNKLSPVLHASYAALNSYSSGDNHNLIGATNAAPSVLQTSSAHGRVPGDLVRIKGVTGNTNINGTHEVAVVSDSTHFTIRPVGGGTEIAGNGVFGGTVVMAYFRVNVTIDLAAAAAAGGGALGAADPTQIDRMYLSFVPLGYIPPPAAGIVLTAPLTSTVEVTNIRVTGSGTLTLQKGLQGARPHTLILALGVDDVYNLTPERLFDNWTKLGYRGEITNYTGASHFFDLVQTTVGPDTYYTLDTTAGNEINPASYAWFKDFYQRAKIRGSDVVVSLSFEILASYAPLAWVDLDKDGHYGFTGYTPIPTMLCDPANVNAVGYLARVLKAHMDLQQSLGANLLFQVGEPWYWVQLVNNVYDVSNPDVSNHYGYPSNLTGATVGYPCLYGGDHAGGYGTRYAFEENKVVNPLGTPDSGFYITDPSNLNPGNKTLATLASFVSTSLATYPPTAVPDNANFPGKQWKDFFNWWSRNMGGATLSIRNSVRAAYPGAKATALWFPPQVFGTRDFDAGLMTWINYCQDSWSHSVLDPNGLQAWDFLQAEAYTWVAVGQANLSDAPDWERFRGDVTTQFSVTNATNASPSVVTTSTAHGFNPSSAVLIQGAVGNTAINGTWRVVPITTTTFSLKDPVTGAAVAGNGVFTGTATAAPVFWLLPDGRQVKGLLGIFRDGLGFPVSELEFFGGYVNGQLPSESLSQFVGRYTYEIGSIYQTILEAFNEGYDKVLFWSDSTIRAQGFVYEGAPSVANLKVTGFPTTPSGKVLQSATLDVDMLGDYSDGGTRFARQHFGEADLTNGTWKPKGEPDGVFFYIPGAEIGDPYPPQTRFKWRMVFSDGTQEEDEFVQQVIATSLGEWAFGTPVSATPVVNTPSGEFLPYAFPDGTGINSVGAPGAWDADPDTRAGGTVYRVQLAGPLLAGTDLFVFRGAPSGMQAVGKGMGWTYDPTTLRVAFVDGSKPITGETVVIQGVLSV